MTHSHRSRWENDSLLIYYLREHCKHESMVSIFSLTSSSLQDGVCFINAGPFKDFKRLFGCLNVPLSVVLGSTLS